MKESRIGGRSGRSAHDEKMLSPESQEQFFTMLPELGATPEEVKTLQQCVCLYKMHTNQRYYNTIRDAVGEALANEWGIAK